jgi:serine/threonine protein kinase
MPLARGGMGQVWVARLSGTRGFQKLVAVKTILPSGEDMEKLELMLFEEASLASRVRHPNVAETLDLGEQNGALYLVMEWVNGEALDYILRSAHASGGVPIPIGVHLLEQACRGLHCAHEARDENGEPMKIVHRDISPQNLLVTYSGAVKLIDFGVAKATQQASGATEAGQVKGKFAYMSPEQIQGEPVDARADVFAMGVVLYRATTGEHPFKGENPAATVRNVLLSTPTPPSQLIANYPKALEDVVMKALAQDKHLRFASAEEMGIALDRSLPLNERANGAKETEVFLRKLFANRMAERSSLLKAALGAADRGRQLSDGKLMLSGFPSSQSTMRAVSLEAAGIQLATLSEAAAAVDAPSLRRARQLRRRVSNTTLAVVAGLAASLVARPHWPHGLVARYLSPPADRFAATAPLSPVVAARPDAEKALSVPTEPIAQAQAQELAASRVSPATTAHVVVPAPVVASATPVNRTSKKRDNKVRRPDATDAAHPNATTDGHTTMPMPAPPAAPSVSDSVHNLDSDPLARQK